jgi:DNA polymerase-3 subunit epsilon
MITEWKRAEQVNGISPETVADKPSIDSMREAIEKIITSADVIVGYNTGFDLGMIRSNLKITPRTDTQIVDVMEDFAEIYGEWDRFRHKWRWQKLTTCADYYGYDWGKEQAHDSLADCRATLFCYKVMYKYKVKEENL